MKKAFSCSGILFAIFCLFATAGKAVAESLMWNEKEKTFTADLPKTELSDLLQEISTVTGWDVYVEPGTAYSTSAKFKSRPRTEALRLLLGELNFEISPQSNSVPKLFVFTTGAEKATQHIGAEKKKKRILGKDKVIENHLIVSLKPGSKMNIEVLAQQLGAKVIGKLDGTDSYLLEFPDAASANVARDQLSKVDSIASIDSNYSMDRPKPAAMASASGGSPFSLKPDAGGGEGIIIGLVDTAVQQLGANMEGFLLPEISTAGKVTYKGDLPTHGTTMAESMLHGLNTTATTGEPSSVKILPVDIYGDSPHTDTFQVAKGIVEAVNGGADIVSLSLGSAANSAFLERLVKEVVDRGIPVFAAAGNEPVATPTYPAAYSDVIAVTSSQDRNGTLASYANYGEFVDVILPGATIVSFEGRSFYAAGTSVSTALASGMMAGLADSTGRPPRELVSGFTKSTAFKK